VDDDPAPEPEEDELDELDEAEESDELEAVDAAVPELLDESDDGVAAASFFFSPAPSAAAEAPLADARESVL